MTRDPRDPQVVEMPECVEKLEIWLFGKKSSDTLDSRLGGAA